MSQYVGRLGWAGIAIETTPGVPVNPTDYIPYVANSLIGKHQPLADIAARGQRDQDFGSVIGKKWSEGDLTINLDPVYSGYFFKMALGTEAAPTTLVAGAYDHTFSLNQSSTPTSASVIFDKGAFRELFPYCVCDGLELDVKDGIATLKNSIKGQFPVTSVSGTNTTTSGLIFTFKDLSVQFGATLAAAQIATPTKVTALNVKIAPNAQANYRSGNAQPDSYALQQFEVTGEYGLLLEDSTDVQNYYNLTKRYAIFTFTGRGLAGGYLEKVQITLYQARINDQPIETGIDSLFALKSSFRGEYSKTDSKTMDVVLRNSKSAAY